MGKRNETVSKTSMLGLLKKILRNACRKHMEKHKHEHYCNTENPAISLRVGVGDFFPRFGSTPKGRSTRDSLLLLGFLGW